jgi:hypothetical protein
MKAFHIDLLRNGDSKPRVWDVEAVSPDSAQQKCRRRFPGCEILNTRQDAKIKGKNYGSISYPTVSTARVEPLPEVKAEEIHFDFWDCTLGKRPVETVEQLLQFTPSPVAAETVERKRHLSAA